MSVLNYTSKEFRDSYEKQAEKVGQQWKILAKRLRELKQKELEEECRNHRKQMEDSNDRA